MSQNSNRTEKPVILLPWIEKWEEEFKIEKARIEAKLFPKFDKLVIRSICPNGIEHIGSTSIRHIKLATPVHDMILSLNAETIPDEFVTILESLGYLFIGAAMHDPNLGDMWFFDLTKDEEINIRGYGFDLHVTLNGSHNIAEELIGFRDYCNTFPQERELYANIKQSIKSGTSNVGLVQYKDRKRDIMI